MRTQARGAQDVVLFFATRRAELERRFDGLARAIAPAGGLWIAWPKRTACVATDLREGIVRELGLAHGLVDNKVCAVDDTWSGLRFVFRLTDRPVAQRQVALTSNARLARAAQLAWTNGIVGFVLAAGPAHVASGTSLRTSPSAARLSGSIVATNVS